MGANKTQQASPSTCLYAPTSCPSRKSRVVQQRSRCPGADGQRTFFWDPGSEFQADGPMELPHDASWIHKYNLLVTPTLKLYKTSSLQAGIRHYIRNDWERVNKHDFQNSVDCNPWVTSLSVCLSDWLPVYLYPRTSNNSQPLLSVHFYTLH